MFKHILLPTDGSELSKKAAVSAVQFARELSAKITILFCKAEFPVFYYGEGAIVDPVGVEQFEQITSQQSNEIFAWSEELCRSSGVSCKTLAVVSDYPHQAIIETAQSEKCDLIYMASHGRKGLTALLLGSETQKVLTHSTIPVLVYR